MIDKHSRKIDYLRISVTDLCNLRCIYCMPEEGIKLMPHREILSYEEIRRVVQCAVGLGIAKYRITGGEPLVKRDIEQLVEMIASVDGVEDLAMTTNGVYLARHAASIKRAGLSRINISLDTLDERRFKGITRGGNLQDVFNGLRAAFDAGFKDIKMNVVVMRGVNEDEVIDFARLSFTRDIEVRFIEFMAMGKHALAESDKFVPSKEILERVSAVGELIPLASHKASGPAKRYRIEGAQGTVGFISPVSEPFCGRCNRLRLTADGKLRSCLLAGGEIDVKSILRSDPDPVSLGGSRESCVDAALVDAFRRAAALKPLAHAGQGNAFMRKIGG